MKKFSKICLIIVAVLGGMGLLLGGIRSAWRRLWAIRRMAKRGELDAGNWHIRPYELYYSWMKKTQRMTGEQTTMQSLYL